MMGLAEIRKLSRDAARKASRERRRPYVPYDEDEINAQKFRQLLPNLGDYEPKGWKEVDRWRCTKDGVYDGRSLGIPQIIARMLAHYGAEKTYGYGMVEEGPFQFYLGVFEKL